MTWTNKQVQCDIGHAIKIANVAFHLLIYWTLLLPQEQVFITTGAIGINNSSKLKQEKTISTCNWFRRFQPKIQNKIYLKLFNARTSSL